MVKKTIQLPEKQNREPVRLKIARSSLDNLAALIPLHNFGRFLELKSMAHQEMQETPEDQFAIIKATPEIIENKKERAAAYMALALVARRNGWLARWSPAAKGFLLVRKDQWQKTKNHVNGGKSK